MKDYDQWRKDNPDWDKDWGAGISIRWSYVWQT